MYGINYGRARDIWSLLGDQCFIKLSDTELQVGDVLVDEFGGVVAAIDPDSGPLDTYGNTISGDKILRRDLLAPDVLKDTQEEWLRIHSKPRFERINDSCYDNKLRKYMGW